MTTKTLSARGAITLLLPFLAILAGCSAAQERAHIRLKEGTGIE